MATIKQGILGGFSGSVGSVVGTSWKGISVMKSKPVSVANPKTAGQTAQREKFTYCVSIAGNILATIIKPLWDRFASKMSGYNDFVATNIDNFTVDSIVAPATLVTSKGKMDGTAIATAVCDESAHSLVLTWVSGAGTGFKLATDKAYVAFYDEYRQLMYGYATGIARSAQTLTIANFPNPSAGDIAHIYLSFLRADGTVVDNNTYKEVTVVP